MATSTQSHLSLLLLFLSFLLSFSLLLDGVDGCMQVGAHVRSDDTCPQWSYSEKDGNGPSEWGNLCASYALCRTGQRQSPINIISNTTQESDFDSKHPKLVPNYYEEHGVTLNNNGHTLLISNFTDKPNTLTLPDGSQYTLLQFHFHDQSEHTLDGKTYPLELHLVHNNSAGEAVLAFFIDKGTATNPLLAEIDALLSTVNAPNRTASVPLLELQKLISQPFSFYSYNGSLTTPPCSENVKWFVSTTVLEATSQQIDSIAAVMGVNTRPIQSTNARPIINYQLHSSTSALSSSLFNLLAAFTFASLLSFVVF